MRVRRSPSKSQAGYLLLSVMLLITLMLIMLAVELPRVTQQIKRAREEELVHRGMEYAKAVKKFRRKMNTLPNSIDQLQDTNHIRFLRKRYKDPMTGEDDWKLVHVGEAEIQLPKNNNPGLAGSGNPGLQGGTFSGGAANPAGGANPTATPTGQTGLLGGPQPPSNPNQLGSLQVSNPAGAGQTFGGPGIIGVVSTSKGTGIKEFHDSNRYDEWLFVYDPRLELAAGANGGGTAGITVAAPRAGGGSASGGGQAVGGQAVPSSGQPQFPSAGQPQVPAPGGQDQGTAPGNGPSLGSPANPAPGATPAPSPTPTPQ
jgi:type II secretory pathway pseudopilin PulG